MSTLYAWAKPAFFSESPMDHTWVTDFDNRVHKYNNIVEVVANGKNYWYSWGDYHILGLTPSLPDGLVCAEQGALSLATCLCKPNIASKAELRARGTIYNYGIDGVCHQLTNQILAATTSKLIVSKVRGYITSSFLFGDYGLEEDKFWNSKYSGCSTNPNSYRTDLTGHMGFISTKEVQMDRRIDTFELRARAVLAGKANERKLSKLLELRRTQRSHLTTLSENIDSKKVQSLNADELNAKHNEFLAQALEILGPNTFQTLFDIAPGTVVRLVDESQLATAS
ncbi:hypothetical protein ACO0LD_16120 [Undibacterium sp. Ji83W]|uniref:hypothetical protein n=1 Tax=Undibacterium sp. Ji83W TaxID=3413043 RepID=UPI003BF36F08